MKTTRDKKKRNNWAIIGGGAIFLILVMIIIGGGRSTNGVKIIPCLFPEDFQTKIDIEYMKSIRQVEDSIIQFIGESKFQKFIDDTLARNYQSGSIELAPGKFLNRPSLDGIIDDCVAIMHIKRPRIFIKSMDALEPYTVGVLDPVVVIPEKLIMDCTDYELRFVIGREFGHIKCGRINTLMIEAAIPILFKKLIPEIVMDFSRLVFEFLGDALGETHTDFLFFWQACREAKLSADNAGLICCQNLAAAEQVILRTTRGSERRNVGVLDVDNFLRQNPGGENMEKARPLKEFVSSDIFAATRIRSLREYAASERYQKVFERE